MSTSNLRTSLQLLIAAALTTVPALASEVVVTFIAEVKTVSGTGFYSTPTGTTATGFFTYETGTADSNVDAQRGEYQHTGLSSFEVSLSNGVVVTSGTGSARVDIENFGSDTFRYREGDCFVITCGDPIHVNGVEDAAALLSLSITETSVFSDDSLPDPFPFDGTESHTFSLGNNTGSNAILLQFEDLQTGACPSDVTLSNQTLSASQIFLATSTATLGPSLTISADQTLVKAPLVSIVGETSISGSLTVGTDPLCPSE